MSQEEADSWDAKTALIGVRFNEAGRSTNLFPKGSKRDGNIYQTKGQLSK